MIKRKLKKLHKDALDCVDCLAQGASIKDITDWEVDLLAESIELLNDLYEQLYDKVFDESLNEQE